MYDTNICLIIILSRTLISNLIFSWMDPCVNCVADIHPEIAHGKKEFWSSLAPLPLEVVLSAGQRAKEQSSSQSQDGSSENGRFVFTRTDVEMLVNICTGCMEYKVWLLVQS